MRPTVVSTHVVPCGNPPPPSKSCPVLAMSWFVLQWCGAAVLATADDAAEDLSMTLSAGCPQITVSFVGGTINQALQRRCLADVIVFCFLNGPPAPAVRTGHVAPALLGECISTKVSLRFDLGDIVVYSPYLVHSRPVHAAVGGWACSWQYQDSTLPTPRSVPPLPLPSGPSRHVITARHGTALHFTVSQPRPSAGFGMPC
jgi:hypothetical protein